MSKLFAALFGCTHEHYTFPRTPKPGQRPPAAGLTGMYVVCLDCAKEFPYDWQEMKVVWHLKNPSDGQPFILVELLERETSARRWRRDWWTSLSRRPAGIVCPTSGRRMSS